MRANQGAAMALDARCGVPHGNFVGDIAFFVLRRAHGPCPVFRHLGNRDGLALLFHHFRRNFLDKIRGVGGHGFDEFNVFSDGFLTLDFLNSANCLVDGRDIHVHDGVAFFAV